MPTDSDRLKRYLVCETPDKQWVTDKLIYLLSGEVVIPPFSAAAIKLGQLSRDENCQMEDVAEVILMDAGLASDHHSRHGKGGRIRPGPRPFPRGIAGRR